MYRIHFTPKEIELGFLKQIEHHLGATFNSVHHVGGKNKTPRTIEVRTEAATLATIVEDHLLNLKRDYKIKTAKLSQQEISNNVPHTRTKMAS